MSQRDELSCNAYERNSSGAPEIRGKWGGNIGIEVTGFITWLEKGDAASGTGRGLSGQAGQKTMSGDNKQPRRSNLGRDPIKLFRMTDVIVDYDDWYDNMEDSSHKTHSSFGYNEALVDNWRPVKVWYQYGNEDIAKEVANVLSARFNQNISIDKLY